jgi:hypothetical protein
MKKLALTLLSIAFLASFAAAAPKDGKAEKISGYVSNDKCGAKDINNADCTKKCADAGSKLVVVSEKDHKVYNVDNQEALKGHEGHHVRVTGQNNDGTLHVDKVDMLKQNKAKEDKSAGEHGSGL